MKKYKYILFDGAKFGMPNHWYMVLKNQQEMIQLTMNPALVFSCYVPK